MLRSSTQTFYHKQVTDRVLAAPASLHSTLLIMTNWPYSPSSPLPGKGVALSQRCLISTTKGGLKEAGRVEWNSRVWWTFSSNCAAVVFRIIQTLLQGGIQIINDKVSNEIWQHNLHLPLSHNFCFLRRCFLNDCSYDSQSPIRSCLQCSSVEDYISNPCWKT